jgi:hypothetical protein
MKKDRKFEKDDVKYVADELQQEKQSFQRYLRESQVWQTNMKYIGLAGCMILFGVFLVLVMNGIVLPWK